MSDAIETLFASRGLRCTRQRKSLYAALAVSRSHPTADDLFRQVSPQVTGMSLATVYNTLEALCASGLVQKLPGTGANGSARYDAVRNAHLHVRCQRTGSVDDVPDELGRRVLDRIPQSVLDDLESHLGFKVRHVHIELIGEYENPA